MTITHPCGIEVTVEVRWSTTWIDITDDVRFIQCRTANRSRLQNTFDSGQLTLTLDNSTRKYDPLYTSGPYYGTLRPGRFVRLFIDSPTASPGRYVFMGETSSFGFDYDPSNRDGTVQLTCTDALARASSLSVLAGTTPSVVDGQTAVDRLRVICEAIELMVQDTGIGDYVPHYTAEFAGDWDATTSHNVLDEIRGISDLELGPIFPENLILPMGLVVHSRHWFRQRPRSASIQAAFGSGGLPVFEIKPLFDSDEIVTAVSMSDENGNTAQVIDAAGVADYGWRSPFATYDRLPARNIEALEGAANAVVALRSGEEFRIDELVVRPGADPEFRRLVPELTLLDRVQVNYQPMRLGDQVLADYFIDGITHSISPGDWTTTYSLWSANRFDDAIPNDLFIIGTTPVGGSESVGL